MEKATGHKSELEVILESKKYQKLSGSTIKTIALATMIIDHVSKYILSQTEFATSPLLTFFFSGMTVCSLMELIGRIAFPLYAFLITEGYVHTRDKKKYGRNLLIFAVISEIPWNLEHTGNFFYCEQNVFFTLFLGYFAIYVYERFKENKPYLLVSLMVIFVISLVLNADYGSKGVGFIFLLYVLRERKILRTFCGCCWFDAWIYIVAFIPINMYNGERGFIKGKILKYAFYIIYPAHLLIIFLIRKTVYGY